MFFFFILAMSSNVSRPIQSYRECVTVIFLLCVALHFQFPFFFQINVKKSTAQSVHCSTFSILFGWSTLFSVQNKLDNISITHRTTLSQLNTTHHTIHSIAHWLVTCNMKKQPPTTEQIMHSKFTKERNQLQFSQRCTWFILIQFFCCSLCDIVHLARSISVY